MISIHVVLSGRVSAEDIEATRDYVRERTGGEVKVHHGTDHSVSVWGHGPGAR